MSGRLVDTPALAATGVPVLLDAAQAIGAIPVDVEAIGCDYYAASGQKWLCGPEGSGCLFVREGRLDELLVPWPGFGSVADPERALEFEEAEGVARLDHGFPAGVRSTWALASLEVFGEAGWDWVHERAAVSRTVAPTARAARPRGLAPLMVHARLLEGERPRGRGQRMAEAGRDRAHIPAFGVVRASVGAWCSRGAASLGLGRRGLACLGRAVAGRPACRHSRAAASEAAQGQAAVVGKRHRERARRADADKDRRARHRSLLHELEREPAAHAQHPVASGKSPSQQRAADDLVHRVVAPHVLARAAAARRRLNRPVACSPPVRSNVG